MGLGIRSLFWAVLLPGLVAGYVPWRYFGLRSITPDLRDPLHLAGLLGLGLGTSLLVACILEFAHRGRGTLSPLDPPRVLVIRGPYRYVRNPMYLAVSLILLGEVLLTRSSGLFAWWAVWFILVNLIVVGYEEPTLRRQFGHAYEQYAAAVGRWLPRPRPW
jgi:protein-S-isoprenylcysteine O-methyltransferase Ste14